MHCNKIIIFLFEHVTIADMIKRMINTLLIYEINCEYPFIYRKSQTFAHKSKTIFKSRHLTPIRYLRVGRPD